MTLKLRQDGWSGCCVARSTVPKQITSKKHLTANYGMEVCFLENDDKDSKKFLESIDHPVKQMDGFVLTIRTPFLKCVADTGINPIKLHEKLQKRDGRELEDIRIGDKVVLSSDIKNTLTLSPLLPMHEALYGQSNSGNLNGQVYLRLCNSRGETVFNIWNVKARDLWRVE